MKNENLRLFTLLNHLFLNSGNDKFLFQESLEKNEFQGVEHKLLPNWLKECQACLGFHAAACEWSTIRRELTEWVTLIVMVGFIEFISPFLVARNEH